MGCFVGHAGGANKPNGTPQAQGSAANTMIGKIGEAVVDEIKVSIQDQITNQLDPQAQQGNQDGNNNTTN